MITDELREWAQRYKNSYDAWSGIGEELDAIADRIDAEHEAKLTMARGEAVQHLGSEVANKYVKLPVDADGVPIRVWDVLDPPADCDDYMPLQVVRLTYDGYEKEWFFDGAAGGFTGMVGKCMDVAGWTHHHAPTVEDVLREFAQAMSENLGMYTGEAIDADEWHDADAKTIAKYAAKLRLAGDAE